VSPTPSEYDTLKRTPITVSNQHKGDIQGDHHFGLQLGQSGRLYNKSLPSGLLIE
jgi:hypothetical protein